MHTTEEVLTVEKAQSFLKLNHPKQRHVRESHVAYLAGVYLRGEYVMNGDAIRFDTQGLMIDGQHHCLAVVKSGIPITILVVRGLPEEARLTIDGGIKRTVGDALSISTLDAAVGRMLMLLEARVLSFARRSATETKEVLHRHGAAYRAAQQALGAVIEPGVRVTTSPLAAFAFVWPASPETIAACADRVRSGRDSERGRPATLIRQIMTEKTRGSADGVDKAKRIVRSLFAELDGEQLQIVKSISPDAWKRYQDRIGAYAGRKA